MDFNLFDLMGLENPVKEEEKKKAEKKAEAKKETKKAEKKKAEKKVAKIKLPINICIPFTEKIGGFTIEGKEEVTHKEVIDELKARYPHLIGMCDSLAPISEDNTSFALYYKNYGDVAKGSIPCKKLLMGGECLPFEAENEDEVDTEILKDAIIAANPLLDGCDISFFHEDGVAVPVIKAKKFNDEVKQASIKVIVPGATDFVVQLPEGEKAFTPDIVKANVPEEYAYLEPGLYKHEKEWRVLLMPKAVASSAPEAKSKGFDISSGNVKVSILFTKLDLMPESFGGDEEITAEQICNFIVASGYPEFSSKRCSIEKASDDLLVAIIKSSTKG